MSTTGAPAGIVPPHPAWRSLLWIAPLTGLWTLLIYWQPAITGSGVPSTAARLMTYGLIALGLWLGLERSGLGAGPILLFKNDVVLSAGIERRIEMDEIDGLIVDVFVEY